MMECACSEEDGAITSLCLAHRIAMTANGLAASAELEAERDAARNVVARLVRHRGSFGQLDSVVSNDDDNDVIVEGGTILDWDDGFPECWVCEPNPLDALAEFMARTEPGGE